MAVSGFEGFEKRLELNFVYEDDHHHHDPSDMGLRLLDFDSLVHILNLVQCTIVSAVANRQFDAYVLSESSLFVYPTKIIIKTCGTTQLLKSIPPLIHHSTELGLTLCSCRYTRGSFIFPQAQPFPHSCFDEEVFCIEQALPIHLCHRKASIMPSKLASHAWHVFTASANLDIENPSGFGELYTIEVCMTELDQVLARKFFQSSVKNGAVSGREMTKISGIGNIIPHSIICDFGFDPCGYSMNGIHANDRYSTIHVTPEDGYSYASYECIGSVLDDEHDIVGVLKRAIQVFMPGKLSVSTTRANRAVWGRISRATETLGYRCRSRAIDEFPDAGTIMFQTFSRTK